MSENECDIELSLDGGGYIDGLGLDHYVNLYLKHVLIHGLPSPTWAYLDIRTEPEFSVHIVGLKVKKDKWQELISGKPLEFELDLTDKFLPFKDKILEAKKNLVEICEIPMKGIVSYDEDRSYLGELELVVEELDLKIVFDPCVDFEKYYKSTMDSAVQSDAERRYDPDRRYEHYHYF